MSQTGPDLNRLRVFYHIYSQLRITSAAEILHITPSAVSQQLKKLEQELRTKLFTRLHKKLVPTPAGKKLYDLVEPLIVGLQAGMEQLELERTEPSGVVRIGAPLEFGTLYLPSVIAAFRRKHEKVSFAIELGRPSLLLPKISSGELDFAFVDTFPTKEQHEHDTGNFSITPVIQEQVVLACSDKYNREILGGNHSLQKLLGGTYISQQRDARALNNWFEYHFSTLPKYLDIALTVANHQALLSALRHHLGLGVIVPHIVWKEVDSGEMVIINKGAKQAVNRISIVQLLDKTPTLREKTFLSHFRLAVQKSRTLGRFNLRID